MCIQTCLSELVAKRQNVHHCHIKTCNMYVFNVICEITASTLTSTDITHCISQPLNSPFHHAFPSTSQLHNQCFASNSTHRPAHQSLLGRGWLWETRFKMVGVGEKGVARCPCSGETTYTHTPNLWHSAVLEADCVAQLLSLLQIMSHRNRDK